MTDIQECAKGDEGNGALQPSASCCRPGWSRCRASSTVHGGIAHGLARRTDSTSTRSGRHHPAAGLWQPRGGLAAAAAGRRDPGSWRPAPPARDSTFYTTRSRRPSSSPPRCCRSRRHRPTASTTPPNENVPPRPPSRPSGGRRRRCSTAGSGGGRCARQRPAYPARGRGPSATAQARRSRPTDHPGGTVGRLRLPDPSAPSLPSP